MWTPNLTSVTSGRKSNFAIETTFTQKKTKKEAELKLFKQLTVAMFRKGGTNQSKSFEMTMEEMQRELGLGVDCG